MNSTPPTVSVPSVVPEWDEIVDRHSARVYRLAYRLTGDPHDAEDLTQEVFVRVFRALPDYTPGTFEGWLHRITTNLFLDQARRRTRIRFDALAPEDVDRAESRTTGRGFGLDGSGADAQLVDGAFDEDVEAALASLPAVFREAVLLCDVEGMSYDEVADALGVKLGTVRSRIHRGRAMLRKVLDHRAPRGGRVRHLGPRQVASGVAAGVASGLVASGRALASIPTPRAGAIASPA